MAVERRNFGKLPVSRGTFIPGTTYSKYNIVVNRGSSFMAEVDGVTAEPIATYDATTQTFTVTDGWTLMSYGSNVVGMEEAIAGKADVDRLLDGTLVPALSEEANDLTGSSNDRVEYSGLFVIRTTAGNNDVKSSEPARLHIIKGSLDDDCNPFTISGFRWNGFNQFIASQVVTGAINGTTIVAGSNKIYYFRCPKCEWGSYDTSDKNNGYLFTTNQGGKFTPIDVSLCESIPAVGSVVSAVATHNYGDLTYWLPNEGYLCVEMAPSQIIADVCAHLAWSNKDDDKFEVRSESVINLASVVSSVHSWGLAGISKGGKSVNDEINFDEDVTANRKWYRRVDRKKLATDFTWTMEVIPATGESDTPTYVFKTSNTDMAVDGLFKSTIEDLELVGREFSVTSKTITTIEDLKTYFGDAYVYYELATAVSGNHSVAGSGYCNDMSTEECLGANFATGIIVLSYVRGLKDYLRGLPSEIGIAHSAIVEAIAMLKGQIDSMRTLIDNAGDLKARSIDSSMMPKYAGSKWILYGTSAPSVVPDFVGQIFIDETNKIAYLAHTTNNASGWKRITDA